MIGCLKSSSQVAVTSMTNFPCLLMSSFQYTAFFFNIFDTKVMSVLAKISMCIFFEFSSESYFYINLFLSVHYQFLSSNCSWRYFLKKASLSLPY